MPLWLITAQIVLTCKMYKKLTLTLAVLLLLISTSFTQNRFSGHAGLNYSSVSSKNSINPNGILGINAGLGYKHYLGDFGWALMPELNYSQEGYNNQRLDYLNIPISIGFDFTKTFNLSVGFQYSYLVQGSKVAKQAIYPSNFAFLVTFEFFPTEKFVTGLRFANGVKNIIKDPDVVVVQTALTYSIQFYIGFTLFKVTK